MILAELQTVQANNTLIIFCNYQLQVNPLALIFQARALNPQYTFWEDIQVYQARETNETNIKSGTHDQVFLDKISPTSFSQQVFLNKFYSISVSRQDFLDKVFVN